MEKIMRSSKTQARNEATDALTAGIVKSRFGLILLAEGKGGLKALYLGEKPAALLAELAYDFPGHLIARNDRALAKTGKAIVDYLEGKIPRPKIAMAATGTAFQMQVWRALAKIPRGQIRSYADVSKSIGRPQAVRAVASACAANPISILIPCHRVTRSDGGLGGYRWGLARKRGLLQAERSSLVG
jgi:AraC family transcriptional regulator of adaptative response/methylated-DNA-[protein]-cysteine methyltransferase